ncbi:hypothetical protein [Mycolicibacterium porcinum]|uniref:hypothetical protein n=1 Tax=Mycolicibacterium porcinum TaxID=39693 RepID=UPI001041CCA8|nr:hypothetical protein [Mycolicibacterium porcinum]
MVPDPSLLARQFPVPEKNNLEVRALSVVRENLRLPIHTQLASRQKFNCAFHCSKYFVATRELVSTPLEQCCSGGNIQMNRPCRRINTPNAAPEKTHYWNPGKLL